jgi:hypothetical protein
MRFHREQFMNDPAEVDWLRTTHLRGKALPEFASFTLAGNEDSPVRLDLYASVQPAYNVPPMAVYEATMDGALVLQPRSP